MPAYIEDDRAFDRFSGALAAAPWFGIDLEFQRERTYFPRLCLIQVILPPAGPDADFQLAIIDPQRVRRLQPIWDRVADPAVETVLHAGRQDMEIAYEQGRTLPRNIFDTQIAAALIGWGDQPGYASLVERVAGVRLSKLETVTDWSRRPLTPGQLEYALDDVRYLPAIRQELGRRLEELGRIEWAREEMAHYEERTTWESDPTRLFLRLPRLRSLHRKNLAVARDLAAWREAEAMRRDEPRNRVLTDDVIVEIARRLPKSPAQLEILRGYHPAEVRRSGPAVIELVAKSLQRPESEWPELPPARSEESETSLVVDLLEVFLRARAREAEIAPSYLGSRHDLAELIDEVNGARAAGGEAPLLLTGWRRPLVGDDLVRIATGQVNLHVDAERRRVTTSNR